MEKKLNSSASTFHSSISFLPDRSSSTKSSFSGASNNSNSFASSSSVPCFVKPVLELQTKFFPVQPRGGNLSARDLRNAGIISAIEMSTDSSSGSNSSSSSTIPVGKLKEPRDLYSTATLLHPIKWPVECQVIPEKIKLIDATPNKLEPFYSPTGKEPQPQPVGVEMGTVVYDYQPRLSVDYFCRATIGGSQDLEEYDIVHNNTEPSALRFESRFESGNLAKAIKVTNMYYELYLRPDLYTERHAQWFYFRIQNTKDNVQYRFSIVNFNKPDSLYRYGLKILMYSEKEAQLNNVGWSRCGQNITYFKNDISPDENGPYYTLTFNLKFKHNNDTVYLAQCYPYTYSTLQNYLKSIEEDEFKSQLLTIRLLCRSLAGNNVHVLTVTSPDNQQALYSTVASATLPQPQTAQINSIANNEEEPVTPTAAAAANNNANKKPVIVISARVHPGETQSSYMMKGIIDFLTSDCAQAKELRDRFIFKLIPMLNPDGVIVGNSRCCLLGQDLNRQYRTVLREAFPQIYHAKMMLRRLQEENGIFLYCDLHGHSRRHNVFIYGCENRKMPERKLVEQVFPLMMHKNAADKNCKFKIQKNKEGTGRVFVWTLGVVNSYTLEISLGGSTMPSRPYTHFNTGDYEACGRHFCETLLDYSDPNPMKENLRERILQKLVDEGSTADEPKNVVLSDYSSLSHSETDGEDEDDDDREDSSPEGENGGNCKTFPLSSISKSSSGVSSALPLSSLSNCQTSGFGSAPSSAPVKQLKRQISVRKHSLKSPQLRAKSAGRFPSSTKLTTTTSASGENLPIRSPLPIHRASVDFTKIKQRKLEEPNGLLAPPSTPTTQLEEMSSGTDIPRNETPEMSASFRRLTKFRRKSRKNSVAAAENNSTAMDLRPHFQLTAKCTRILFDDPFNPPGTYLQMQKPYYSSHHHHHSRRTSRNTLDVVDINTAGWQSGTEDECDPEDNMGTLKRFPTMNSNSGIGVAPTIKITDYGGGSGSDQNLSSSNNAINEDNLNSLMGDMARLKVSKQQMSSQLQRSSSDTEMQIPPNQQTYSSFAPFVPSFPVGKAFLHQTFYPDKDKSTSPIRGEEGTLRNSLSDTTIATGDNLAATVSGTTISLSSMNPFKPAPATTRRGSIGGYQTGTGNATATTIQRGKLQATGSTILAPRDPIPASRRRVSWTGTLTVSVPTVPTILRSTPCSQFLQNRKSFRKSKSLNDNPGQQQQQHQRQSSTEMSDSAQSLIGSISLDKITSGNTITGVSSTKSRFGNYNPGYSHSQSVGNLVMSGGGGSSAAKKKRGKLKRTKNK